MLHEDLAERVAGRLEARADALEREGRRVEPDPKEVRTGNCG
jgi:hypothetical protein